VADDRPPAGGLRHLDRLAGLGQRADLVELDQDRVRGLLPDGTRQALGVGHQQIVAHDLDAIPEPLRQRCPTGPVVLGQAVLQADDRIAPDPVGPEGDQVVTRQGALLAGEDVAPLAVDLGRGRVEGDRDLLARSVAGPLDGLQYHGDGVFVRRQAGGIAALVAHGRGEAALVEELAERVEGLCRPTQRLGEGRRAERRDHEFLEIGRVLGVLAAVQDVHQRHGQDVGVVAKVPIQRLTLCGGCRVSRGQRHAEQGIGAQPPLVR